MTFLTENHLYTPLEPKQLRQYIDSESIFLSHRRARQAASEVKGSMRWRPQNGAEYLIRQTVGNAQKSLGPRSEKTERTFAKFTARKNETTRRLASISTALEDQQRMNKALRVGRVPEIVVKVLSALERQSLADNFVTIGTHSLYAYETACGVRVTADAFATGDTDLLFDSRKRLSFVAKIKETDISFIAALRKADPTFRVLEDQKQTAENDDGFQIDVVRRSTVEGDPHPLRMSDDEEDLWAVQIDTGNKILGAERFSQMVVSPTGHMAMMHTMHPMTFVAIKRELTRSDWRDPKKRVKDGVQADLVEHLVQTHMPHYKRVPGGVDEVPPDERHRG